MKSESGFIGTALSLFPFFWVYNFQFFHQSTDDDAMDALSLAAKGLETVLFSSEDDSEAQVCFVIWMSPNLMYLPPIYYVL